MELLGLCLYFRFIYPLIFSMYTKKTVKNNWDSLLARLPSNLEETAQTKKAIIRKREVKSASDLLRLVFAYSMLNFSLRDVTTWAFQMGIAVISDVAILKRFLNCPMWLKFLISLMLKERTSFAAPVKNLFRIRIFDASLVNRPGSKGSDYRLHAGFDLSRFQLDYLELTTYKVGESLTNFTFHPGDVALVDRGYSHRRGVWHVKKATADVIVRMNWQNFPLQYPDGQDFDLFRELRKLRIFGRCDIPVQTIPLISEKLPAISGRVIAMRKDKDAAEKARRKAKQEAKKKGRQLDKRTLEACDYIFIFTTLSEDMVTASEILEIYRFRWQIELLFKRLKGVMKLDEISARKDQLCETFLLGKLLAAILVENTIAQCEVFTPEGINTFRPVSHWRLTKAVVAAIISSIGTIPNLNYWQETIPLAFERYLDRPRKRLKQSVAATTFKLSNLKKDAFRQDSINESFFSPGIIAFPKRIQILEMPY
jgi:hypothetical protein